MSKIKIEIIIDENTLECEDCGFYESDTWTIFKDGEFVNNHHYDGHLGGGDLDIHDPAQVVKTILESLGFEVILTPVEKDNVE